MTAPQATAYVVTDPATGVPELLVIPGPEGSGEAPVLRVELDVDADTGTVLTDVDDVLRRAGWRAVRTHVPGVTSQPGMWTPTAFGAVATVERCEP